MNKDLEHLKSKNILKPRIYSFDEMKEKISDFFYLIIFMVVAVVSIWFVVEMIKALITLAQIVAIAMLFLFIFYPVFFWLIVFLTAFMVYKLYKI